MSKKIILGVKVTKYIEIEVPNNYDTDYRNPKHVVKAHDFIKKDPESFLQDGQLEVYHCNRKVK